MSRGSGSPRVGAPVGRWVGAGACWLLCVVFAATGLGKLLDVPGFAGVLAAYRVFPTALLPAVAWAITLLELGIALALAWPAARRVGVALAGLVAFGNAVLLWVTLARGIALDNCGCFGVFLARPLTWATPFEDVALLGFAWLAWRRYGGAASRHVPAVSGLRA